MAAAPVRHAKEHRDVDFPYKRPKQWKLTEEEETLG